ncbi:Zn-dependent hydrolase [Pseudoclavibacter endophyticus]|uniref:MBL fold metallo-hydrolase n=1 Tax=Pseudoclavibacter endophyticus TaxID=1778590 RepID=A0A6H9WB87_9MICO|nr:MBL fold metallo-hydrolase [Pseudoclavibacter endophyticus]KAB1647820.1 MBL fold metallo-hydrolase [Pseudoclavibacter endophyticus]GGA73097.1 Zn-dependent hydrolase [Pseudoclavibacter endophyticus]
MSPVAASPADLEVTVDDAGAVEVSFASVSDENNIAYLLVEVASGAALLIDAADHAELIGELVSRAAERAGARGTPSPRVEHIVTTHQHWDHHRALEAFAAETGATISAGADDAPELPVEADRRLHDGDTIGLGQVSLDVVHLRGHTPGSVALALTTDPETPRLFTGDSLFPGGVGNTFGRAEDFARLIDDVEHRIFDVYPDATVVYPGHGAGTTLGAERPRVPEWRERGW